VLYLFALDLDGAAGRLQTHTTRSLAESTGYIVEPYTVEPLGGHSGQHLKGIKGGTHNSMSATCARRCGDSRANMGIHGTRDIAVA